MTSYDVIVIGGGPAGATAATLVAEKGHRVLLFERDVFPRFKIGESLMPGTYWTLQRLGMLDKLHRTAFPKKFSVQFYGKSGRAGAPFYFSENEEGPSCQTWQVLRSDFDQIMLDNACEKGVEVVYGTRVLDVLFQGDRASGVRVKLPDGEQANYSAKVVVDASGQSALLARQLKMVQTEPKLRKAAIFSHFRGVVRDTGIDEGATVIFHTKNQHSWFWFIPLPEDVVSVGVVGDIDYLLRSHQEDAQQVFHRELQNCPALLVRFDEATQLFPVKTTKEFSYKAEQLAGPGWVLVGDAFGFLDPIYSSGVFLALKSAELAADAITEALEKQDLSKQQLMKFAPEYLAGMESIRKLVYAFYSPEFSFGKFLKKYPECRTDIVNILVGNVFRTSVNGLFEHLGEFTELPEDIRIT